MIARLEVMVSLAGQCLTRFTRYSRSAMRRPRALRRLTRHRRTSGSSLRSQCPDASVVWRVHHHLDFYRVLLVHSHLNANCDSNQSD